MIEQVSALIETILVKMLEVSSIMSSDKVTISDAIVQDFLTLYTKRSKQSVKEEVNQKWVSFLIPHLFVKQPKIQNMTNYINENLLVILESMIESSLADDVTRNYQNDNMFDTSPFFEKKLYSSLHSLATNLERRKYLSIKPKTLFLGDVIYNWQVNTPLNYTNILPILKESLSAFEGKEYGEFFSGSAASLILPPRMSYFSNR